MRCRIGPQCLALVLVALVIAMPATLLAAPAMDLPAIAELERRPNVARNVTRAFTRGNQAVEVHVALKGFAVDPFFYRPVIDDTPQRLRAAYANLRTTLLAHPGVQILRAYPDHGSVRLRLSLPAALAVARNPYVHGVAIPEAMQQNVLNAVEIVNIPPLHAQGLTGQGSKIAFIDKSFIPAALPGLIVQEECFCTTLSGAGCCPNGSSRQSGPGASTRPITDGHGTTTASVIRQGDGTGGAPEARVVAIAVDLVQGVGEALNWLVGRTDIQVVNMSLSRGGHPGVCDKDPEFSALLPAISALRRNGVAVVANSGNNAYAGLMGTPACLSPVIGVTGTWACNFDAKSTCNDPQAQIDRIWKSSIEPEVGANSSSATAVAAPAAPIRVQNPFFGVRDETGTSYSAPLVAACAALLHQARPGVRPETLRGAFRSSPTWSTGPGHGSFPRLDCPAALNFLNTNPGILINQHGITGSWFEPQTTGQGFTIEILPALPSGGGLLFAGWFTFEPGAAGGADRQRWYTLSGDLTGTTRLANLTILRNVGGNFDAPPVTNSVAVGSATVRFDNCTEGALTYNFTDGSNRSGVIPLTRITAPVGCSESLPQNGHLDFYLSGTWYEPATSGQGLLFEVNPVAGRFAATWFTYAPNGEAVGGPASQRWYTIQSSYSAGSRSLNNLEIYATTGGVFDDSTPPTTQLVGTANLQFHDCYSATLTYNFTPGSNEGRTGSMDLTRALAPPGCTG